MAKGDRNTEEWDTLWLLPRISVKVDALILTDGLK